MARGKLIHEKKPKVENFVPDFLYGGQGGGVGGLWTYNHCVSVISEHTNILIVIEGLYTTTA